LASTIRDEFPSQGCSLPGSPAHRVPHPDHESPDPRESTDTETLFMSAPSEFHATQVYTPETEEVIYIYLYIYIKVYTVYIYTHIIFTYKYIHIYIYYIDTYKYIYTHINIYTHIHYIYI